MLNSLGLLFFIPLINTHTKRGLICSIILINGLLCHSSKFLNKPSWKYFRNIDIFTNILFSIYIIIESNYKTYSLLTGVFSGIIFAINYLYYNNHYLLHIFGVQLPGAIAISLYYD